MISLWVTQGRTKRHLKPLRGSCSYSPHTPQPCWVRQGCIAPLDMTGKPKTSSWSKGMWLVMWLVMHYSCGWSCTDHMTGHALIMWLVMHWSCTDHVTRHVTGHATRITHYVDVLLHCLPESSILPMTLVPSSLWVLFISTQGDTSKHWPHWQELWNWTLTTKRLVASMWVVQL